MQAIAYTQYGGPEVTQLVSLPVPQPGPCQVQVRVVAGGLNPIDWHQRNGELKAVTPYALPVVAGNEFSGIVTALGTGVDTFAIGDRVVCRVAKSSPGALGEYAVQSASLVAKVPENVSLLDAAGLPLAGLTAQQGLDLLDVKGGDRILITAGSGGVGPYAIQLAKLRGAHVTTTASEAGYTIVKEAGADEVINYKTETIRSKGTWAKVLDLAGRESALIEDVIPSVESGGKIVSIAGPLTPGTLDDAGLGWKGTLINGALWWKSRAVRNAAYAQGVEYQYFFMNPDGQQLATLVGWVDEGILRINIDSKYEMKDYAKAFERLESGRVKGKVIIEMPYAKEL